MFKEVADIKTSDQLHLPVPEAKFETVVVKPSEIQKEMVQNLSERAAKVHSGTVDASEDNMLCITNDGRKIGLDQRLMNPLLPDDPASKLNACVRNVLQIWEDGREQKLTQLLFCDLSTPKNDGQFNVYDDISLSAYIRKMALDGYCLNLDLPQLRRMSYLLQNCSNNLNQVAKRVNESNQLYAADIEDLRHRLDELIGIGKQILSKLSEL